MVFLIGLCYYFREKLFMMMIDLHTHTIASGHGSKDTLMDMAIAAAARKMQVLGISDHGPAMLNAAKSSYFRSLRQAARIRNGVRFLYGAELSILSEDGDLDLSDEILSGLDYAIASLHGCGMKKDRNAARNTKAYIAAMKNPKVCIIGHPDDTAFPYDAEAVVLAAKENHVLLELNNASLTSLNYRGDSRPMDEHLLRLCMKYGVPVIIGSDSHGTAHIGEDSLARALLEELSFPEDMIANDRPALLKGYLPLLP